MDGYRGDQGFRLDDGGASGGARRFGLSLLGVLAFVVVGIVLEERTGIRFDATYRIACIGMCQYGIYLLTKEYSGQRWPVIAFWTALAINLVILVSPLTDREPSRGELMLFALPDAVVVLTLATASYTVTTVRERAIRQQLILGLVVAAVLCAVFFGLLLVDPHRGDSWGHLT